MRHETNTFPPLPTTLETFGRGVGLELPPLDDEAIRIYGAVDFALYGKHCDTEFPPLQNFVDAHALTCHYPH